MAGVKEVLEVIVDVSGDTFTIRAEREAENGRIAAIQKVIAESLDAAREEGRAEERAAVVAWLRKAIAGEWMSKRSAFKHGRALLALEVVVSAIEAGEHLQ